MLRSIKNLLRGMEGQESKLNAGALPKHAYLASSIHARNMQSEQLVPGNGLEVFDQPDAIRLNQARMDHLASLELPLKGKRVLDVGCGVGHLAQFFVNEGCEVVCVDGRQDNIDSLRSRYPNLVSYVADVETDPLSRFGTFDVVFCYGLLYHLENPLAALRNLASVCCDLLLLETLTCDHVSPLLLLVDEPMASNQALRGLGCRPSPSYVALALNRAGFEFIYAPRYPPEHQDFKFQFRNSLDAWRDNHPLRCVLVTSRTELRNPKLHDVVLKETRAQE